MDNEQRDNCPRDWDPRAWGAFPAARATGAVRGPRRSNDSMSVSAYSSSTIAPASHESTQLPQSMHSSGSMMYMGSPSLMASEGQESMHEPHIVHLSVILYGMGCSLLYAKHAARPIPGVS